MMEILTLPIQLSAQAVPPDIAADTLAARLGLDVSEDLFAAVLARQLGMALDGDPDVLPEVVESAPKTAPDVMDGEDAGIGSQLGPGLTPGFVPIAALLQPDASPVQSDVPAIPEGAEGSVPVEVDRAAGALSDAIPLQSILPGNPVMAENGIATGVGPLPDLAVKWQALAATPAGFAEEAAGRAGSAKPDMPIAEGLSESLVHDAEPGAVKTSLESVRSGTVSPSLESVDSLVTTGGGGNTQAVSGLSSQSMPLQALAPPSHSSTAQVAGSISHPVASPAWGEMLGERVVWMAGQQQQTAELHLNPPSLGPLEVRVSVSDGQANLTFSTQHMPVREAIEAATPRLREMLGESGIGLGSVSVNVGSFSQQQGAQAQQGGNGQQRWAEAAGPSVFARDDPLVAAGLSGRQGLLDVFA
jgi:flagellar hook-length control protein FliK